MKLDLEKIIIILCLLGIPAVGAWIYTLKQGLEEARVALGNRQKVIREIYETQERIDKTKKANREVSLDDGPRVFFEKKLSTSQGGGGFIKEEQMRINFSPRRKVRKGGTGREIGEEIEAKIEFYAEDGRKKLALSRSFINAFIVNCESPAPIWRLRSLKMSNTSFKAAKNSAPKELELPDNRLVDTLAFARRSPSKPKKK